jgi:predicted nuclease with TOPRIM domain
MFKKSKIQKLKEEIESLKEQNEKLKDTVIESVDLVSDFRRATDEMNRFVNHMYKAQIQKLQKDYQQTVVDEFNEFEQEDVEEYVENILKKKTQIH